MVFVVMHASATFILININVGSNPLRSPFVPECLYCCWHRPKCPPDRLVKHDAHAISVVPAGRIAVSPEVSIVLCVFIATIRIFDVFFQ